MKKQLLIALLLFSIIGFSNPLKAQSLLVYQYWNSTLHRHFYTTNSNELGNGKDGWILEGIKFKLYATGSNPSPGFYFGASVYRFYNSTTYAHYYTMNMNVYPNGFHLESIMGYTPPGGALIYPVYEFYGSGDYYYSTSSSTPSGYVLNGIAYYAAIP
jgi:hypothetical protein